MDEPHQWSLCEAADAIARGRISTVELTAAALTRVQTLDPTLNAFIHVEDAAAMAAARAADAGRAKGERSPLLGVPVARKDLFQRRGQRASWGSAAFADHVASRSSDCVERLDAAGAVDLGGLNMSEFAFHVFGLNSLAGPPRNPWDTGRIAGGSSGGSAAALAARLVFGSLGSDTGGSIRNPAALCGVTGLVPTHGRVSPKGMLAGSASLDAPGPMARTAADCARLFAVLASPRGEPAASLENGLGRPLDGIAIGVLADGDLKHVSDVVRGAYGDARAVFERLGCRVVEIEPPPFGPLNALASLVFLKEAAEVHAGTLRENAAALHPEVRDRLLQGFAVPKREYDRAMALRARTCMAFCAAVFADADVAVLPSAPDVAPQLAEVLPDQEPPGAGLSKAIAAVATQHDPGFYTRALNYLGLPALALPAGFSPSELPLGIQLIARPHGDETLLGVGHRFQQATDFHTRRPPL